MSFWSALKKVGTIALGIERVAGPIAAALYPPVAPAIGMLDTWVQRVTNTIVTVEQNSPIDGQGQVKSLAVIADFEAGLDFTNSILAARHKRLDYDKQELQNAINGFVAGYNALAKVKASFKEVDL